MDNVYGDREKKKSGSAEGKREKGGDGASCGIRGNTSSIIRRGVGPRRRSRLLSVRLHRGKGRIKEDTNHARELFSRGDTPPRKKGGVTIEQGSKKPDSAGGGKEKTVRPG